MRRIRLDQVRLRVPFPSAHSAALECEPEKFLAFTELLLGAVATHQIGRVAGQDIRQLQSPFIGLVGLAEQGAQHAERQAGSTLRQRRAIHALVAGTRGDPEVRRIGRVFRHVLDDDALPQLQRGAAGTRIVRVDAGEVLQKLLADPPMRNDSKRPVFAVIKLDVAEIGALQVDRAVEHLLEQECEIGIFRRPHSSTSAVVAIMKLRQSPGRPTSTTPSTRSDICKCGGERTCSNGCCGLPVPCIARAP